MAGMRPTLQAGRRGLVSLFAPSSRWHLPSLWRDRLCPVLSVPAEDDTEVVPPIAKGGRAQGTPLRTTGRGAARPSPLRVGLAFALLLTVPTFAQPSDNTDNVQVMPPWVIEGTLDQPQPTAHTDYFASALGPSSVVTTADWSGRGIGTLAEALRQTPGVMLQESFGGFEPPRISIRGSGLDSAPTSRGVALLVDGLPLARADGAFHSGLFDPELFSQVEIYRGTLHMALTPAVLGGVINAVSLVPNAPASRTLQATGGDFGASRAELSATTGGDTPARMAASYQQAEGFRAHSRQERYAVQAAARHALTPATQLEVSTYAATANYDVPGPLTLSNALSDPRSVFAAVKRDQPRRDSSLLHVAAHLKTRVPEGGNAFGLAWQQLHDDFYQLQPNGETDLTDRLVSGDATFSRRLALGSSEHQLLARFTGTTGKDEVDRYLNVLSRRGARFGAYTTRADTAALSVEDVVWLRPTFALGAGFTALHGTREVDGRAPTPTLHEKLTFDDFSPRGALLWSPDGNLSFHAAVSRSIEPPTFDDLVAVQGSYPNLTLATHFLAPQSAVTCEVGVRGSHGPIEWSLTAYHANWRNEILRLADANGLPRGAVNAGRTIHDGLESSLRWRLLTGAHQLTFTLTSTLGHFTFDDDPVYGCNRIAGAPPHTGSAELLYEAPHGFFTALETTWVDGRVPVDHGNRLFYDGDTLANVRIGWRPIPRLLVFAAVRNIFDRATIASTAGVLDLARNPAATTIFLPGPGRSFNLGLEVKL